MCAERKGHGNAQGEGSHLRAKGRPVKKQGLLTPPRSWTSRLQNQKVMHLGLNPPVCDVVLRQAEQVDTQREL